MLKVQNVVKGIEIEFSKTPRQGQRPTPYQTTSEEREMINAKVAALLHKGA